MFFIKKFSRRSKNFFFLFPILVVLIIVVGASFWAPFIVDRTWLNMEVSEFNDSNNNPTDQFQTIVSGYDLLNFEQTGEEDLGDGTYVYYGDALFGWDITHYTTLTIEDVFTGLNRDAGGSRRFAHITRYNGEWKKTYNKDYYVEWREVDWSKVNQFRFNGYTTINMSLDDKLGGLVGQEINGTLILGTEFLYEINEIRRVDWETGVIGDYDDKYTDQELSSADVVTYAFSGSDGGDITQDGGKASTWNAGWTAGGYSTSTIYNEIKNAPEFYGTGFNAGEISFDIPIELSPRIEQTKQSIAWRYVTVSTKYDGFLGIGDGIIDKFSGVQDTGTDHRTTSVHVTNFFIRQKFETTVSMVATVKYEVDLSETESSEILFEVGDAVWNEELSSAEEVTVAYTQGSPFIDALFGGFNWIVTVIFLIVGVYVFIKVLPIIRVILSRRKVAPTGTGM